MGEREYDQQAPTQSLRRNVGVLIVDDEEHLARMFQRAISEEGYPCDAVFSPEDALERVRLNNYKILIADILMPVMNGIQLMKEVKAVKPNVKVIFITGAASVETAVQTMKMGASDFIPKPFDVKELCRRVNRIARTVMGRAAADSSTSSEPDTSHCPNLPGYRIIKRIGVGSMGSVFQAHQIKLNRLVAIKVIRPSAFRDSKAMRRFVREAHAAARMNHPNIIQAYDLIEQAGYLYLVMEYFPSRPLSDIVEKTGPLAWQKALWIASQMGCALIHATSQSTVHRDVKPTNILVGKKWLVKLTDFGLAKERTIVGDGVSDGGETRVGAIVGTPAFMSPEQATAAVDVDVRSDIYSLGLVLYFMLEGRQPYSGSVSELIASQIRNPVPEIAADGTPDNVKGVVVKMTEKNRDARYQNASALLVDLRAALGTASGFDPDSLPFAEGEEGPSGYAS